MSQTLSLETFALQRKAYPPGPFLGRHYGWPRRSASTASASAWKADSS
jgi:hypothetical protein